MPMLLSSPFSVSPPSVQARTRRPMVALQSAPIWIFFSRQPAGRSNQPVLASRESNPAVIFLSSSSPPLDRGIGSRRCPELGILSVVFVISMALGSCLSLAIASLPALSAFRSLKVSTDRLSKVVSEEVPGTLSSLKLSSLEINELASQLSTLRQRLSGNKYGKKGKTHKRSSQGGGLSSTAN